MHLQTWIHRQRLFLFRFAHSSERSQSVNQSINWCHCPCIHAYMCSCKNQLDYGMCPPHYTLTHFHCFLACTRWCLNHTQPQPLHHAVRITNHPMSQSLKSHSHQSNVTVICHLVIISSSHQSSSHSHHCITSPSQSHRHIHTYTYTCHSHLRLLRCPAFTTIICQVMVHGHSRMQSVRSNYEASGHTTPTMTVDLDCTDDNERVIVVFVD